MAGRAVTAASEARETRQRRTSARADNAALVEALDRLLEMVYRRLDQIEALAAEQTAQLERSQSERELALRERVATLEASQSRLQAEVKRREQEWQDTLQEIEHDRQLLTDAWQRLEQERLEVHSTITATSPGARATAAGLDPARAAAAPPQQQAQPGTSSELVTREILRQFQNLKGDVRRTASGQGRGGR